MGWTGAPHFGDVYRIRNPTETRHVLDRTLGDDVIFVRGRYSRYAHREQVTQEQWDAWAKNAQLISEVPR